MTDGPQIVLDANILIRAALGRNVRKILVDHAGAAQFFAPEIAYHDAQRHLPTILRKHQRDAEVADRAEFLGSLVGTVHPVSEDVYVARRDDARRRISVRDEADWPILALALTLRCPIWTEDKDFFGAGVLRGRRTVSVCT